MTIKLDNVSLSQRSNIVDINNPALPVGAVLTLETYGIVSRYEVVMPKDARRYITLGDIELPVKYIGDNDE